MYINIIYNTKRLEHGQVSIVQPRPQISRPIKKLSKAEPLGFSFKIESLFFFKGFLRAGLGLAPCLTAGLTSLSIIHDDTLIGQLSSEHKYK